MYGTYWNMLDFWKRRNNPNMLIIKYEDMKRNMESVIKKTSKFLDTHLTKNQISALTEHLSFDKMSKNPYVNYESDIKIVHFFMRNADKNGKFMRRGEIGSYKSDMDKTMEIMFDDWIEKNMQHEKITF